MSLHYNTSVGSAMCVLQKLVLLLPMNFFNGFYVKIVVLLTWENVSANATCAIFGLTAELQYCLLLCLDLSSTYLGIYIVTYCLIPLLLRKENTTQNLFSNR